MSLFGEVIMLKVYGLLSGDSALSALVAGVHDHVPQTQSFPFVAMGELVETEFNNDDAEQMNNASLTVHVYSRKDGRKETHTIMERISRILHRAAITASGFNFVSIDHAQSQSFTDADGMTRHGVVEFNIIITEV